MKRLKNWKPDKLYSLDAIIENGWIYWIKSRPTLAKYVNADLKYENIFKATKWGEGSSARYLIKGIHILEYIVAFESNQLHYQRK